MDCVIDNFLITMIKILKEKIEGRRGFSESKFNTI